MKAASRAGQQPMVLLVSRYEVNRILGLLEFAGKRRSVEGALDAREALKRAAAAGKDLADYLREERGEGA